MRPQVANYGGGTQSAAICLLISQGKLPRPDRIVIADTVREADSTWEYLHAHIAPLLRPLGLTVEVASHDLATVDLYAKDGTTVLPVFTTTGKLSTFCSNEWKAPVVQRHLRQSGVTGADMWIGFTLDEAHRASTVGDGPWRRTFPLIDLMLTRHDCEALLLQAGLPLPHKSACYMCPHRNNAEWRVIRDHYPQQWQQAVAIDEELRAADDHGGVFLHRSLFPLAVADIDQPDREPEARQCGIGYCMH